jgi:hypothetical protein
MALNMDRIKAIGYHDIYKCTTGRKYRMIKKVSYELQISFKISRLVSSFVTCKTSFRLVKSINV